MVTSYMYKMSHKVQSNRKYRSHPSIYSIISPVEGTLYFPEIPKTGASRCGVEI